MSSDKQLDINGLISIARVKVSKEKFETITSSNELAAEYKELLSKTRCYGEIWEIFKERYKPSMRIHTLKKGVEVKFNISDATRMLFFCKLEQAEYKRRKVVDSFCPPIENGILSETFSEEEKNGILLKLEEYSKALGEVKVAYQNLTEEWKSIKVELHSVLDDCIQRSHQFVVEAKRTVRQGTRNRRNS